MTAGLRALLCVCATLITASLGLIAVEGSGADLNGAEIAVTLFVAALIGWLVGGQRPSA